MLMSQISTEMVQAQKRYFGRGPTQAKSYLVDDFLVVVLRGGMTTAESTLLRLGREHLVRHFRQELEHELARHLIDKLQELTGRTIVDHQAQVLFNPDVVVKMFFFKPDRSGRAPGVDATAKE